MTKLDQWILNVAKNDPKKTANTVQIFLIVIVFLFVFFALYFALKKIDITIPVNMFSFDRIQISKTFSNVVSENQTIIIKYKNKLYYFTSKQYDYQFPDFILVTISPSLPDDMQTDSTKLRLVIDQKYMFQLLFRSQHRMF